MNQLGYFRSFEWFLPLSALPIMAAGLVAMNSFSSESYFTSRQIIWIIVSLSVFFIASFVDWRFLRRTSVVLGLYLFGLLLLVVVLLLPQTRGVRGWLDLGFISFQPVDLIKLILIIVMAKYFSRRHIDIAHFKHIIISGIYVLAPVFLVFIQPDLGSVMVIFLIWLGLILISGVSRRHLLAIFAFLIITSLVLWGSFLEDYQKQRIISFINPLSDISGAGYNAFQSMIAVGSGEIFGKGVGFGTQSRLEFLPEYQTDFIFAAFAEEWGFVGVLFLFGLFGLIFWRIFSTALRGATNFELLFGTGLAIYLMGHFIINVGMNIGLLPIAGIPLPLMSYGGSHLLVEFLGLGILSGMRRYSLAAHRLDTERELLGVVE